MGGLGRTRHGTYAQFTCVSSNNVFPLETSLLWPELSAVPESYVTAWSCLFGNLNLTKGDVLLVRGAISALGQAAAGSGRNRGRRHAKRGRDCALEGARS